MSDHNEWGEYEEYGCRYCYLLMQDMPVQYAKIKTTMRVNAPLFFRVWTGRDLNPGSPISQTGVLPLNYPPAQCLNR